MEIRACEICKGSFLIKQFAEQNVLKFSSPSRTNAIQYSKERARWVTTEALVIKSGDYLLTPGVAAILGLLKENVSHV